jgi:hypothetical protein
VFNQAADLVADLSFSAYWTSLGCTVSGSGTYLLSPGGDPYSAYDWSTVIAVSNDCGSPYTFAIRIGANAFCSNSEGYVWAQVHAALSRETPSYSAVAYRTYNGTVTPSPPTPTIPCFDAIGGQFDLSNLYADYVAPGWSCTWSASFTLAEA